MLSPCCPPCRCLHAADSLRSYLYGEWDPEEFRDQQLPSYVQMCRQFAADVQQQLGCKGEFERSPSPSSSGEQQQEEEGGRAEQAQQ